MTTRNFLAKKIFKGMYPATYNFKDDADGAEPAGWTSNNGTGCTTTVITSVDGHRKVLQLNDTNNPGRCEIYPTITQTADQAFEMWLGKDSVLGNTTFYIYFFEGANRLFYLYLIDDDVGYYDGGFHAAKANFLTIDHLEHIKVVLDDTANTFDIYINGVLEVNNAPYDINSTISADKVLFRTETTHLNYKCYVDAFGASADTDYAIGDNIYPYFYMESEDSFEGDDVGTQGTSITWVGSVDTAASFEIVPEFGVHKKVLRGYYSSGAGGFDYCTHTFSSYSKNGWFAAWIKSSDVTVTDNIWLNEEDPIVQIRFSGGKLQYYDGALADWVDALDVDNDTYYFIYIQWYDAANDIFDFWVDNVLIASSVQCTNNQLTGIGSIALLAYGAASYIYIDAPMSSLDGDVRGDNRLLDYNDHYTRDDITADISNVTYSNLLGRWRECSLFTNKLYEKDLYIFQIYDINGKLAIEGELKGDTYKAPPYTYILRDKNWDELNKRSSNTFSAAQIHDPADSTSMLKVILPTVGQEDGDLILVNADKKTDTYSPVTKYHPDYIFLKTLADLADSCVIIEASGKTHLDDDRASGTVLDVDTPANKDLMTDDPKVIDVLETINYYEIYGAINPETGSRFYKEVDNSAGGKKRRWHFTNNDFRTQTDLNNYAAKLEARVIPIRSITIHVRGLGVHDMGTTMDYKFVTAYINIPQANYYIVEERINFEGHEHIIVLSEGMIEGSKYAATFEKPQEYLDAHASEIYETDINTIQLRMINYDSLVLDSHGWDMENGESIGFDFYIDDKVDDSKVMVLTFPFERIDDSEDSIDVDFNLGATKTDGTEDLAYNIENGTGISFPACGSGKLQKYSYTVIAAGFESNDLLHGYLTINEAGKNIFLKNAIVRYYVKRTI